MFSPVIPIVILDAGRGSGGGPPADDWILRTGFWDDSGSWHDEDFWID